MSRKVWQSVKCSSCRHDVLETFASLAGVRLRPTLQSRDVISSFSKPWQPAVQPRRYFSAQTERTEDVEQVLTSKQTEDESPVSDALAASSSVPWYLQVDAPVPPAPSIPLLDRQVLPTVPSDAPPLLSPILTYLSNTAGLDNLLLLDLRHLDPPPALGANLIMLIGTARSVKHLNVSADRFCRWCRSNYKLRPYADGLLGRNELKLKLRRKARRQKLAQSVGNTLDQNKDDGITTGWICINVGPVDEVTVDGAIEKDLQGDTEDVETQEEQYENPDDGYIGFGSRSTAPRIVVQIFTEEKRQEMDLEGLWEVRNSRRVSKEEKADAEVEMTNPKQDVWGHARSSSGSHTPRQKELDRPKDILSAI